MKPFDLERAIAGDPLVTRDGKIARFIAHVPECDHNYRVIAIIEGAGATTAYGEDGHMWQGEDRHCDLMMAPKKRTVYLNVYDIRFTERHAYTCCTFDHRSDAIRDSAVNEAKFLAIAVPIEIEE